ncbi:MAG: hypothetical protein ACKPE3_16730 [Sphaerospermopsis kisseleviana]
MGQVWKDNDKRAGDRQLEVLAVDSQYALVVNIITRKKSRILLKRFQPNSTGYTLIVNSK